MTKDIIVEELEKYLKMESLDFNAFSSFGELKNANVLKAMELLASMKGWKTQRCMKQGQHKLRTNNV